MTFLPGIWVQFYFSFVVVPSADLSLSNPIVPQDTTAIVKNRYIQVYRLSYYRGIQAFGIPYKLRASKVVRAGPLLYSGHSLVISFVIILATWKGLLVYVAVDFYAIVK